MYKEHDATDRRERHPSADEVWREEPPEPGNGVGRAVAGCSDLRREDLCGGDPGDAAPHHLADACAECHREEERAAPEFALAEEAEQRQADPADDIGRHLRPYAPHPVHQEDD